MAFATIQITQSGVVTGGSGESVIGLVTGTNITLTDDGGAGATSYLWEILQWPAPDAAAPTVNNSATQVATVVAGAGLTDGVYIVRLTRDDPVDGVSTDVKFFAIADADGLSLPSAGMNRTMSNVGGSAVAQAAGWFGSKAGGTNVFLDAYLRTRKAREGLSKVSSNDTTFGLLGDKIVAGTGVAVQTLNDGGNETVEISLSVGTAGLALVVDTFTASGGDGGFTLTKAPNDNLAAMFVEGIGQQYGDDFTVSGTALTYAGDQALEAGQRVMVLYMNGGIALESEIAPAQITADQNDYAPTGWNGATVVLLSSDASRNITGAAAPAGGSIRKSVFNVGSNNIVLINDSASSSAANRFALLGDITILPNGSLELVYDSTNSRWRML